MAADEASTEKRARFRFKAEIYDTDKNEENVTFFVINVKIYGLNVDEYEIRKRYSQFAELDTRLKARFHHKRLPVLPPKSFTKSTNLDDEFIAKRKIALNRYLRGLGQRLYLQNCESIWSFFNFIDKINPYLHRYRVLHLKSIQCNDYQFIDPNEQTDDNEAAKSSSSSFSFRNLFSGGSSTKSTNKLSLKTTKSNKKVLREWRVIYGTFIESNVYLAVSTIHADNTKNNWWDTFMTTASDAKAMISSNNPVTQDGDDEEEEEEKNKANDDELEQGSQSTDTDGRREERLESVDFDSKSDLNAAAMSKSSEESAKKQGLSAWEAEKLAFAQNEFYLGKIEIFTWQQSNDKDEEDEIMYKSHCRFPLVRNRPSCGTFIAGDDLLIIGTADGKILCFKLDRKTATVSHICYLPQVFGGAVTDMVHVPCSEIYYQPSAYEIREENPLPRGNEKSKNMATCFIYAVSSDCNLGVFDLRSGDCLGHIQTGITGNLSITYCCEKFFVSNRSNNNIVVFIRSSKTGDPVPQTELIGHTTTVYCLHADEHNKRLFSGSGDNSVAVWYYDKLQDTMLQIQQLKSVSKSTKFTCITTARNINCLIAGSDNGFITVWHEYDINCDELSDKMYDLRMLIKKRTKEQKQDAVNKEEKDEEEEKPEEKVKEKEAKVAKAVIDISDDVPPSWTQHKEILKQNERRYDISKNNLKNGSISSKKSKSNMVWKCVYTWKAHKGSVTSVTYLEQFNMLMSTAESTVRFVHNLVLFVLVVALLPCEDLDFTQIKLVLCKC